MALLTYQMLTECTEREIRRHLTFADDAGRPETRAHALTSAAAVLSMWHTLLVAADMVPVPENHQYFLDDKQRLSTMILDRVTH